MAVQLRTTVKGAPLAALALTMNRGPSRVAWYNLVTDPEAECGEASHRVRLEERSRHPRGEFSHGVDRRRRQRLRPWRGKKAPYRPLARWGAMPPSVEMGYFPPARRNGCTYTLLCPPSSIMYATHRPSGENTAEDSINAVCANGNSFEIAEKRQHPDIERRRKSACDRVGDEPPIAGPIRRRQNHSIRVEEQRVRLTCVDQFLMQRAIARAGAQAPEHHSCAVRSIHTGEPSGAGSECLARWHVTIDIDEPDVAIRAVRTIHRDRDPAYPAAARIARST